MKYQHETISSYEQLQQIVKDQGIFLPFSRELSLLAEPLEVGGHTLANRIAIQPMEGCDASPDGSPGELTMRRYRRFAASGAALIWVEAVAVVPEGRANPRQMMLTSENLDIFRTMVQEIKTICDKAYGFIPVVAVQLTHSGRYSKPGGASAPLIACHHPVLERGNRLPDSCVVTDEYLGSLEMAYAVSAGLAEQAGFDMIDIKACHQYLASELLSAFTRKGRYGGSYENRTRFLRNAVRAAASSVSRSVMVTTRMNLYDGYDVPHGWGGGIDGKYDLTEPLRLVSELYENESVRLMNFSVGNPYYLPHINRPYNTGPYSPPENPLAGVERLGNCIGEVKRQVPNIAVLSSGNSYLGEFSPYYGAGMIQQGMADLIGYGRMPLAYPCFAGDMLSGKLKAEQCCIACSKCTELMRAGTVSGCAVRDSALYAPVYRKYVTLGK